MATPWRLAGSLTRLRGQINDAYQNRNKASDGTIGDAAHAATDSDHNPNAQGVVTAFDVTHDPANGLDIAALAEQIVSSKDPRVKYLIRNREILIPANGWRWTPYSGADPHTSHLHISVGNDYDNSKDWTIKGEPMSIYTQPLSEADIKLHYSKRLFREATAAEIANAGKTTWGKVLDDNVTELGKRLQAAESKVQADYEEAGQVLGQTLYRKK